MKKYDFIALDGIKINIERKNDYQKSILKKSYYLILYMVYWFVIKFYARRAGPHQPILSPAIQRQLLDCLPGCWLWAVGCWCEQQGLQT